VIAAVEYVALVNILAVLIFETGELADGFGSNFLEMDVVGVSVIMHEAD
jgi:hypothetical protein